MLSSTAPPQCCESMIHAQYSAFGFPRKPSVYVNVSPATASAMTLRSRGASFSDRDVTYPTALKRHELSLAMTLLTATVPSSW